MKEEKNKPWAFSRRVFCDGMRDGFPIALGYFAVLFPVSVICCLLVFVIEIFVCVCGRHHLAVSPFFSGILPQGFPFL